MFFEGEFIPGEIYEDKNGNKYRFLMYCDDARSAQQAIFLNLGSNYSFIETRFRSGKYDDWHTSYNIIRHVGFTYE